MRSAAARGIAHAVRSAAALFAVVVLASCAADARPQASSNAADDAWRAEADVMTPLLIDALAPAPIPVRGSDEAYHAAYELTVLNFSPRPATITTVETLAPDGSVLQVLRGQQVTDRTMVVADYAPAARETDGALSPIAIPSGKTALLVLEVSADTRSALPESVTHRITATFGDAETGGSGIAVLWPDTATQTSGEVTLSSEEPVVIGAPLGGDGWVVSAGCCSLNVHRNVLLPVGGRINGGERYAIDVSQIDVDAVRAQGFTSDAMVHGDPTHNEDYRAHGAAVLAVADAEVVVVHASDPDTVPGTLPLGPGFTLANLGGNVVVLELASGLFAVYYHLAPDSPTVQVGDRVTKGQQIARLGNSGNTSAAHLHFQLSRTPLIFSSDSVPYEFEEFSLVGRIDDQTGALIDTQGTAERSRALPLALDVIDFP